MSEDEGSGPAASAEENEDLPGPGVKAGGDAGGHGAGLVQLTDEQIRTWTLEQKDRWWLENVYKGDMPQLTLRSALTGMFLGGLLSLTNLYVGAKTGWTLGVGITSVILAFAMFKVLSSMKVGGEFTLLENNAMQSIATSAGYMTAPMISSLAAYMMVTGKVIPMMTTMIWITAVAILGVLFAFPLKRRFINDEQLPFPEGRAAGVVMDALHSGDAKAGLLKAKILVVTGGLAALLKVAQSEAIMKKLKLTFLHVPEYLDDWLYKLTTLKVSGVDLRQLTVRPDTDFVMMAAGGLMGIRTGVSIMIGAGINYLLLAPWAINAGDIHGKVRDGVTTYGFRAITMWALWGGVAMMTTASLFAFFSKPQILVSAFKGLFGKKDPKKQSDVLKDIELPMSVFVIGIPVVGGIVVALAAHFFDVKVWMGILAVPLIFVFTLIAVNSTGLTSITPSGALGKLTQLTYGVIAPGNITTNLMTAGITGEVAGNASNLLMDIKPGYMLGGKPRHQAVGHVLGIVAGALVSVPVFYLVFMRNGPANLVTDQYPMPGATIWKAVAEVLTKGLSNLEVSARWMALVGAIVGIALEVAKVVTKGRFWISGVGIGLAFVIPFNTCLAMFLGSFLFWLAERVLTKEESTSHQVFVKNMEPTCAGLIAGGALMGIGVILLENFVL
ncbi:MAG: OPT/YSL family transporter [Myxococcales bacterium]|nr:OPT/YSL family transporter [Myxococcales bacterium]